MAPTVEEITDETALEKMLEEATIFEDRKKIRARLRELRKQKRGDTEPVNTERKRTRASAGMTVNTSQSGGSTITEIKPSGSTALSPVSPAAKTVRTDGKDHTTTVVEKDDGKTQSMTTTSVKTGPGMSSTQVTTMTKSNDGSGTKSAAMKQETTSSKTENNALAGKPKSKFQLELDEKRRKRTEQQKAESGKWKEEQETRRKAAFERKKLQEVETQTKKTSLMDKFGGKAQVMGPVGPRRTVAPGGSTKQMAQNPATIKAKLLEWSQRCTKGYTNVKIQNFSSSWCDGMAFCALVHSYYPNAFEFSSLDPKNRRVNFDLAFDTAEKLADIYPLLETDDMLMMKNKPDWKCVFTYVQALYRGLHKAAGQVPS